MNPKCRVEILAAKYWEATISQSETRELRQLLFAEEQLSVELQTLKIMLLSFDSIGGQIKEPKRGLTTARLAYRIAAAVAVICGAIYMVNYHSKELGEAENEVLCYINSEPITDLDTALEQIQQIEHLDKLSQTITRLESILNN